MCSSCYGILVCGLPLVYNKWTYSKNYLGQYGYSVKHICNTEQTELEICNTLLLTLLIFILC